MTTATITGFDEGFRGRCIAGIVVSLLAHVAFGVALVTAPDRGGRPQSLSASLPPPDPEEPLIQPGIEQSRAVTINWLGFEIPTEHRAAPADTDQAALSPIDPGLLTELNPSPAAAPAPEVEAPPVENPSPSQTFALEPAPADQPEPSPERAAEAEPEAVAAVPTPGLETPAAPRAALPAVEAEAPTLTAAPLLEIVRRAVDMAQAQVEASRAEPAAAQAAPSKPSPASQPTPAAPAGGPAAPDAVPSPKQASATSQEPTVEWAPGRPVAAQGLDITTVDPHWTIATRLTAVPRNPVVRLEFGRDGRVRKAEFLPGQSTGSGDVDGPLLDALYRWTAKGEALRALPADQADAMVAFNMRIVLVRPRGTIRR